MEVYCTRPRCPRAKNLFADLDNHETLKTTPQKYCTACGMSLILRDRYLPIRLLGQGGFGTAFLAIDRDSPRMRQCVVKLFQPAGNLAPTALEKAQDLFKQEAAVLEKIGQHDQIPNLYAYFEITAPSWQAGSEKLFYLVQEYIDGQNLEEELVQKGKFSETEVLEVFTQMLRVLKFVHDDGTIHRDIKPSNIMRRRDGKLFLLDFGAVKQVTNAASSTGIYSPGFAPPEQMAGGQVFASTDLYALAVTMVVLLTGLEPNQLFDSYNNQWQWRSYVNIHPDIADIFDKMLRPSPNQRFSSTQEILELLQAGSKENSIPSTLLNPPQPLLTPANPPRFSTWELLTGAAFSGFQGAMIVIALLSFIPTPMAVMATAVILGMMIFAQTRGWIKKSHLLIIAAISLSLVIFIPFLHKSVTSIPTVLLLAVVASLIAIAMTALFRLIYKLLSLVL